jgi:hypothetical protein
MFSKKATKGSSLVLAALGMLLLAGSASADIVTTHGAAFQAYEGFSNETIHHSATGVYAVIHQSIGVIAPVARSSTSSSQNFYIDGNNSPGYSTSFTLYAYDWSGNLQSSVSFSSDSQGYDLYQSLSPIDQYSYVSLYALLPPNGGGTVRGIAAL